MNIFSRTTKKDDSGFTLIETLVAVAILATAISAPMIIAQTGVRTARQARDGITVQFLAMEALELLHNKRDENVIDGVSWDTGLRVDTGPFRIDTIAELQSGNGIESCAGSCEDDYLYFDEDSSIYSYDTDGEETIFVRTVEVERIQTDEVEVTVTISWERTGRSYTYEATKHLFDH